MDRLKKEWKETEIPEELRLRARNLAWAKLHRPAGDRRVWRWSAAAATTIAAITLWTGFGRKPPAESASPPVLKSAAVPARPSAPSSATPEIPVKPTPPPSPSPARRHAVRKPAVLAQAVAPSAPSEPPERAEEHERIVLNFTLPESGAQLIWIIDSNFNLNGDIQ